MVRSLSGRDRPKPSPHFSWRGKAKYEWNTMDAAIIAEIRRFHSAEGYYPTRREIAKNLKMRPATVHSRIGIMQAAGLIRRNDGKARLLRLCEEKIAAAMAEMAATLQLANAGG